MTYNFEQTNVATMIYNFGRKEYHLNLIKKT